MSQWAILIERCVVRPSYLLMLRAYADYLLKPNDKPCKAPGVDNQCAVRMSVALERCGMSLNAFQRPDRVHRNRPSCKLSIPHVLGAEELCLYLQRVLGAPESFAGASVSRTASVLAGRHGIIYFNNCFTRQGQAARTGDHIDLWTGDKVYNQIIGIGAGGDAGAGTPLFSRAQQVKFFSLT